MPTQQQPANLMRLIRVCNKDVTHRDSPHFNDRPDGQDISLLVIHCISLPAGEFGKPYVEQLFMGRLDCESDPSFKELEGLRVSAHLFIKRDGSVTQFVDFSKRAWHAGISSFEGRENCNDYSIGIELEGLDSMDYTEEQYKSLADATRQIQDLFPLITEQRITAHSTIAPKRKTDPGPLFDWQKYAILMQDS